MDGRGLGRRTFLLGGTAVAATGSLGAGWAWRSSRAVEVALYSTTVGITGETTRVLVAPGDEDTLLRGSRVLRRAPGAARLRDAEQAWLARAADWTRTRDEWSDLTRSALLDVRTLLLPDGASVAGWSPNWRYTWPRDAAHVVAALALTGHHDDALGVLKFLQGVPRPDGIFEARYLPDGSGPPDGRTAQLDGLGWTLWSAGRLAARLPDPAAALEDLRPLLTSATDRMIELVSGPTHLPPVSPDYWEVAEQTLTLGTAAPLLAGLQHAVPVLEALDDPVRAALATTSAARLGDAIRSGFGPRYPRHLGGDRRDAAVAFLLPPYAGASDPAVVAAAELARREMGRPGGGLAPGAGWKNDGISWTPETALFALAAASTGRTATARELLGWLASHRTPAGSVPEKVLHDGRPAAVAPLGWTSALVLLTVARLRGVG